MSIGLFKLISTQKVLKTCNEQCSKQHYLGTNRLHAYVPGLMDKKACLLGIQMLQHIDVIGPIWVITTTLFGSYSTI